MIHSAKQQNTPHAILICLIPILFFLCESIRVNSFGSLFSFLAQDIPINAFLYARLSSAYLLGMVIFLIPFGLLLDNIKTKYILICTTLICSITAFNISVANNYESILINSFIGGIGAAPCFIISMRLVKEWISTQYLSLSTGLIVSVAMLGGILAKYPLLILTNYFSWRSIFSILAALEIILLFFSIFIVENNISKIQPSNFKTSFYLTVKNLKNIIATPINWIGGLFSTLLNLPLIILGAIWGQPYLQVAYKLSANTAAIICSFIFIGVMLGSPLLGWLANNSYKRKLVMLIGTFGTLLLTLLILFLNFTSIVLLFILFFLLGFFASIQLFGYTIVSEENAIEQNGTAMSLIGMLVMCGGVIIQPLVGWILDFQGNTTLTGDFLRYNNEDYRQALLILPICFLIAIFLVYLYKKTKK
jgi:MFS family permease